MLVLRGKSAPVGDFEVVRALPQVARRFIGPFCFLDHFGPAERQITATGGVGPHPHIGLATVTYLFSGEVDHHDSLGTVQRIRPGDVNWMSAGRGIVHSERPPPELIGTTDVLEGLQLWVGLPTSLEESAPSFQHADRAALPSIDRDGVTLQVVLGAMGGLRAPIDLASPTLFAIAELEAGAQLDLPTDVPELGVYVVSGAVGVDGQALERHELGVIDGSAACVTALAPARVALIGGAPLDGPRFMLWNFVSSRRERLEQARLDWKHGRFPRIASDDAERVAGPGE